MAYYKILLMAHIVSGFLALVMGMVAIITKKGSKYHILTGKIYHIGMLGVFLTSTAMYLVKGPQLLYLLLIGIFSYHQVITGIRYLKIANKRDNLRSYDYVVTGIAGASAITMQVVAVVKFLSGNELVGWLLLVFGAVLLFTSWVDIKQLWRLSVGKPVNSNPILLHIGRMGGGYIATFTAFAVTNLTMLPTYIGWFGPALIGTILTVRSIRMWRANLSIKNRKAIS